MSTVASAQKSPKKKKNKDYSNTIRVFDQDGYRLRADSVCFKDETKQEVLMISSRNEDSWSIPGGGLEPNEQPDRTAVREAVEEAGVIAEVLEYIGCFDDVERKTRTKVYTLVVTEEAPSWKEKNEFGRHRQWFKCDEAVKHMMAKTPLKGRYLQKACEPAHVVMDHHQTNGSTSSAAAQENSQCSTDLQNGTPFIPST